MAEKAFFINITLAEQEIKLIIMPLKIVVPYKEKDIVKSKGAFWDVENKTWFVPDHREIHDFMQWIDVDKVSIIVKSPFYIGVNHTECYKCNGNTTVISLASDNFYYLEYDDEEKPQWLETDNFSFFSMPDYIDEETIVLLADLFPNYKIGYSRTVGGSYWANHCEHCGALQGDFYLHSEPGGAFFPMNITEVKSLTLISVDMKFDLQLKADLPGVHNEDDIFEFSNIIELEGFKNSENLNN